MGRRLRAAGVLALITAAAGAAPGAASADPGARTLEVTPEIQTFTATTAVLTAQLSAPADALSGHIQVRFEIESGASDPDGNTPQTPDLGCTVLMGTSTCSVSYVGGMVTVDLIRAWLVRTGDPVVDADATEGRFAGGVDCFGSTDPDCESGTAVPGAVAEPDVTDAVEVRSAVPVARTLEVSAERHSFTGPANVLTAQLSAPADAVSGPVQVRFELESGANDPDGNTPQTPDLGCTVLQGTSTCSVSYVNSTYTRDVIRAWIVRSGDPAADLDPGEGRFAGSGDCLGSTALDCEDEFAVPGAVAEPDATDVVDARTRVLEVSPETGGGKPYSGPVEVTAHVDVPVTAVDGGMVRVAFEIEAGSGSALAATPDDGDTPATPDGYCYLDGSGRTTATQCKWTYHNDSTQNPTRIRAWLDDDRQDETVEADRLEGRYAGIHDCTPFDLNNCDRQTLTSAPGGTSERDFTDVVQPLLKPTGRRANTTPGERPPGPPSARSESSSKVG